MTNPYEPTEATNAADDLNYHGHAIAFVNYCMTGGIAWIVTAAIAKHSLHWNTPWPPAIVFIAFTVVGCIHLSRAESGGKLLIGTLLIWFPFPIKAGISAYLVFSEMSDEVANVAAAPIVWWTVTVASIALGWMITSAYLRFSRRRSDSSLGLPFVAISWAMQLAVSISTFIPTSWFAIR